MKVKFSNLPSVQLQLAKISLRNSEALRPRLSVRIPCFWLRQSCLVVCGARYPVLPQNVLLLIEVCTSRLLAFTHELLVVFFSPCPVEKGEWQSGLVGTWCLAKVNPPQCLTGTEHFWKHGINSRCWAPWNQSL